MIVAPAVEGVLNDLPRRTLPRITIVTVVLNSADMLERTIQSVLEQPYANLAHVIIDGGSTDGTVDVIRKYSSRLSFWLSEKDEGIYHAMNKGWAAADADSFVLFLGAGDRLLTLPTDLLECSGQEVVYGDVFLGDGYLFRATDGFRLKLYNTLHHQALLVNRSLHPAPPFDTRFKIYADFDFNQRLMKKGVVFRYSPAFRSYALPGGVSTLTSLKELVTITDRNFGFPWSWLSWCGFTLSRLLPGMSRFRPVRKLG